MKLRKLIPVSLILFLVCALVITGYMARGAPTKNLQLRVLGNRLVNMNGSPVVLHGVDISGSEYACVDGSGIFAGPSNQASVNAVKTWDINAVRIPLNEACWNGEAYVSRSYSGARYRSAISTYVKLLNANGIVAILELHWTDGYYGGNSAECLSAEAVCQKPMPDAAEAIPFWHSVASTFKNEDSVIYDLFNEPFPDRAVPTEAAAWKCWLDGGSSCSPGISYRVAGMQKLVNTVRAAKANNVIMVGGLAFSNDLAGWLKYEPIDPDHNLVASWHSYSFNSCNSPSCWIRKITPVIASVPVVVGEIGETDCADSYIDPLMDYLDSKSTGYLAWAWNTKFSCSGGPGLIANYSGAPTIYGAGFEQHLQSLAGS